MQASKCPCVIATCRREIRAPANYNLRETLLNINIAKVCLIYLVDCAVTGSDVGTASKPCFSLRKLWEYTLIPAIAQLVDTGGPCEGATVVVQQDNAGPHIEASYSQWIRDQFDLLGWLYEPQAPQGRCHV